MSRKELPRPGLLAAAVAGRITNREGARALHVGWNGQDGSYERSYERTP